jgi:hypothetical protein
VHRDQRFGVLGHGVLLISGFQGCAQRAACLVQSGLDCSWPGAQLSGSLGVSEPVDVEKRDRLALTGWKRGDGRVDLFSLFARGEQLKRVYRTADWLSPTVVVVLSHQLYGDHASLAAKQSARHVQTDADPPRAEPLFSAQMIEPEHGSQNSLLRRIGRQLSIAEHPPTATEQCRVMPIDQLREREPVAAPGGAYQLSIATVIHRVSNSAPAPQLGYPRQSSMRPLSPVGPQWTSATRYVRADCSNCEMRESGGDCRFPDATTQSRADCPQISVGDGTGLLVVMGTSVSTEPSSGQALDELTDFMG